MPVILQDNHPCFNFIFDKHLWSPTNDEILSMNCDNGIINIIKSSKPNFLPVTLAVTNGEADTYIPDITWSPSGQYIFYWGASGDHSNDIWMMNRDGSNPHALNINDIWRMPTFAEWVDPNTLLYSNYSGGGHSIFSTINIATGEKTEIALAPGEVNQPNNGYVPVTYEPFLGEFHMLVISNKLPTSHEELYTFQAEGHYSRVPEFNSSPIEQTITSFNGWQPNTDQILISWKSYSSPDWVLQKQHLLLWDVVNNSLSLIAPNSFDGGFSSDGLFFANSTIGQEKLIDGKPVDYENNYHPSRYVSTKQSTEAYTTFLQIFDIKKQVVIMSLPGLYKAFSPNGQFLIFTTAGKVQLDNSNLPIGIVQGTEQESLLQILDLRSRQLVNSLGDVSNFLGWSPDNNNFLYQDLSGNICLYNIEEQKSLPITRNVRKLQVSQVNWSYDGYYFILTLTTSDNNNAGSVIIIKTPSR
jgi:hypothetical protein